MVTTDPPNMVIIIIIYCMKLKALWKGILQCHGIRLRFNEDALTGSKVVKEGRIWT
jgi:hypothetical protein